MNNYTFEVNESLELYIYDKNQQPEPLILQPTWPDGTPWGSPAEAQAWAEAYIESVTNPDCEYLPGSNPSEPTVAKPIETVLISQETTTSEIEQ